MNENTEFDKFDAVARKVFSVSHDEIVKREKLYKQRRKRAKKSRATNLARNKAKPDS